MIPETAVRQLKSSLRGPTFSPGELGYDEARTVPNAMIDRRPAIIARSAGAADVIACVRVAREHDVLVSVRGGGHSIAGKAVCDGGLMIDMSAMKGIHVDPARRTARAQAGLRLGEFDRETQAFGLATTQGVVPTVGIAGLTLGGGWGQLHGKFGLTIDNVIGADEVTSDGRLLTANASENEDLFWGIRGGSGNFGVVTSIEYRLHEVGPVYGGAIFFPAAKAREVLRLWREFCEESPDEVVNQALGGTLEGTPVVGLAACYCGPVAKGEEVLRPFKKFAQPFADMLGPMTYVQIQSMFEPFFPPGRLVYTKSNFLRSLGDEVIENVAEVAGKSPSPYTFAPCVEHWHGAATRVAPGDTAFPHRQYSWNFFAWSMWTDPAETEKNIRWTRECWEGLKPFLIAGAYGNYVTDEGEAIAREAYGCNYDRLVALKDKYDPTNFFSMNHNIKPFKSPAAART